MGNCSQCNKGGYNTALVYAIDEHAPLRTKTLIDKPRAEWFSFELIEERRFLRSLERKWLHTKLEVHGQIYKAMRSSYNKNMEKAKTEFYRNRIQAADSKELFSIVDKLSSAKGSSRQIYLIFLIWSPLTC